MVDFLLFVVLEDVVVIEDTHAERENHDQSVMRPGSCQIGYPDL
jgi:hypothetical protein